MRVHRGVEPPRTPAKPVPYTESDSSRASPLPPKHSSSFEAVFYLGDFGLGLPNPIGLLKSLSSLFVSLVPLTAIDSDDKNHDLLVNDLINQPVPAAAKLYFVAIRQRVKAVCLDSRFQQDLCQFLLELLTHGIAQLLPLFQCAGIKVEAIGHPALPSRAAEKQAALVR